MFLNMPNQRANGGTRLDQKKVSSILVKIFGCEALNPHLEVRARPIVVYYVPYTCPRKNQSFSLVSPQFVNSYRIGWSVLFLL